MFIILAIFFFFSSHHLVSAQNNVRLEASVGTYYFSASGFISPYASVVMTSQDLFLSSTVADEKGYFQLPKALVNDGFNNFCLEAVDIRRIGASYTCFEVEMPKSDFSKDEIFLPPTVGLSGRRIEPGVPITASGYSMPIGSVDVNLGDGYITQVNTDENGFYNTEVRDVVPPGQYELFATAEYRSRISEKPTRTYTVAVLGLRSKIPSWFHITGILFFISVLILLFIILLLLIFWKRRRKDKNKAKGASKPNRFRKLFS